jgi:UDP-N-acetylmuramoylalanine--D-glutamate ligase
MSISSFAVQQQFNVKNALASSMVSELIRVRKEAIRASLDVNSSEEHRLESVYKINGVQYINDAGAQSVNATFYSIDCVDMPIVWIVEGDIINADYMPLLPLVREKVKAIICIGYHNENIINTFGNVVEYIIESSFIQEAVQIAYKLSESGDAVLMSPSTNSNRYFESFQDRGTQFKSAVRSL